MKWTVEAERYLAILAIQQDTTIKYNTQTIIDSWPTAEKPTYRAVQERLNMLKRRDLTREAGGGQPGPSAPTPDTTVVSGQSDLPPLGSTDPVTPAVGGNPKGLKQRLTKGKVAAGGSRKRKRDEIEEDAEVEEEEEDDEEETPVRRGSKAAK